ncbi:hypothetical protein BGZ61DRAFT_476781 [Ilyonectria robusta]|uniref:uncharacterized protein n=1 Tax=Ilyonectria robusta TaxID=1079257 RepID=UPI001E8EC859|nr:uncharacterized protein BGZ61DRAFT_476781 [Ilyonectria robusta]KAH8714734.1 hypothetical protein BGZ61DRAFT_476781 [Ilyonectria robusta]
MSTPRSLYKDLPLKLPRSIRMLKFDDAVVTPHAQTVLSAILELTHAQGQEAEIFLSLRVVNLDDKPDYHALSYTWGPPTREAAQVNLKAEIYKNAKNVIIWLGIADKQTDLACAFIRKFAASRTNPSGTDDQGIIDELKQRTQLSALASLFDRTWFTRVWAVQELVLAQATTVLCGSFVFNWDDITEMSHYLATSISQREFHAAGLELQALLYKNPAKLAAERDVSKAYIGIARYILEHSSDLLLLAHREGEDFESIPSLPSWVPDWNVKGTFGLGITGYERFSAAAGTEAYVMPEISEQNVLTLRAAKLDTVVQVGETKEEVGRGMPFVQWLDILKRTQQVYHTGENRQEVLWRSLITNTDKDGKIPVPDLKKEFSSWIRRHLAPFTELSDLSTVLSNDYDAVLPKLSATAPGSSQLKNSVSGEDMHINDEQIEDARKFDSLYSHALLLRLFRTDKGYIGVGSQSMKRGDSVWIVPGSRVPLLFRPSAWTEEQWRLVGGAYVHGFMQGEASRSGLAFENIRVE